MGFTTPKTMNVGDAGTSSDWNTYVRDNVTALQPQTAVVATAQTTASTSYVDLATTGPAVTLTTGTQALVTMCCNLSNSGANATFMGYAVSGASTVAATDNTAVAVSAGGVIQASYQYLVSGLTAGSNTFTAKYRVAAGTGTFSNRAIVVEGCY